MLHANQGTKIISTLLSLSMYVFIVKLRSPKVSYKLSYHRHPEPRSLSYDYNNTMCKRPCMDLMCTSFKLNVYIQVTIFIRRRMFITYSSKIFTICTKTKATRITGIKNFLGRHLYCLYFGFPCPLMCYQYFNIYLLQQICVVTGTLVLLYIFNTRFINHNFLDLG